MADTFRTRDDALTGVISYQIELPAAAWFRREFLDCLRDMTLEYKWVVAGSVSVEDALQAAENMYWSLTPMLGTLVTYATTNPPANVLPCDGTTYERSTYPDLYAALSSQFIVDSDHFITPDLRGRAVIGTGAGSGLTARTIGDNGGEEKHSLTSAENGTHNHTDSGHIHSIHSHLAGLAVAPGELPVSTPNPLPEATSGGNAAIGNSGSGTAHENMPPFLALKVGIVAW